MTALAVLLSAYAAWLAIPGRPRPAPAGSRRAMPSWLRARDGALRPRIRALLGCGAGVTVALWLDSLGVLVAGGVGLLVSFAVAVVLGQLEPAGVRRQREQRLRDLPHVLDLLSGCLGAGLPLRRAVRAVTEVTAGALGEDLTRIVGLVDIGVGERQAWDSLANEDGWGTVARDIGRAAESGTGLRRVLDRHAERTRRAAAAGRQERAKTLGVRSVLPLMMCFLPAFVLVGIVPTVGSLLMDIVRGG